MSEFLNSPSVLAAAFCFLGIAIGVFIVRLAMRSKISSAFQSGRKEFDREREVLSEEMREQLSRIRGSLIQSIDAYESLVKSVEQALPQGKRELKHLLPPQEKEALEFKTAGNTAAKNSQLTSSQADPTEVKAATAKKPERINSGQIIAMAKANTTTSSQSESKVTTQKLETSPQAASNPDIQPISTEKEQVKQQAAKDALTQVSGKTAADADKLTALAANLPH